MSLWRITAAFAQLSLRIPQSAGNGTTLVRSLTCLQSTLRPSNLVDVEKRRTINFAAQNYFMSFGGAPVFDVYSTLPHKIQVNHISFSAPRNKSTLRHLHKTGCKRNRQRYKKKSVLDGNPYAKGIVLKTLVKKPRKPNSANRKCVLVKLSNGKEMIAYVPGEGHNLQEHNTVLVYPKRLKDTPGVKLYCVRGKYDLRHVVKKTM